MLGRVELRFFRSLDHLVLVREFSPEDVVERLQAEESKRWTRAWKLCAHLDAETRRRVDPFPGLEIPTHCGCKVWHKEANLCMTQCPEVELPPEALMG